MRPDHGEPFYGDDEARGALLGEMGAILGALPVRLVPIRLEGLSHRVLDIWNVLAAAGYADGCEYYIWAGDDVEFLDTGWPGRVIEALRRMPRPNFGAAALFDVTQPGAYTFPVVHRTHLDIFGGRMFPPEMAGMNQFGDPWSLLIYRPWESTSLLFDARVRNACGMGTGAARDGQSRYDRIPVTQPQRGNLIRPGHRCVRSWSQRANVALPAPRGVDEIRASLLRRTFWYERFSRSRCLMRFLPEGHVVAAGGGRQRWTVSAVDGTPGLEIHGESRRICRLVRNGPDTWQERPDAGAAVPTIVRPAVTPHKPPSGRPVTACSICTRKALGEFLLMKYSLERFHPVQWLVACDAAAARRLGREPNVAVIRHLDVDDTVPRDDRIHQTFYWPGRYRAMPDWDYLLLTTSAARASWARRQLALRQQLGLWPGVRQMRVIAEDPDAPAGSGGGTVRCLLHVLARECPGPDARANPLAAARRALARLRILIVHAAGSACRLGAYAPVGKCFLPLPAEDRSPWIGRTLLDRTVALCARLPAARHGAGQIVIAAGDMLLHFAPSRRDWNRAGIVALACEAHPDRARHHGCFLVEGSRVRRYVPRPSPAEICTTGLANARGRVLMDAGLHQWDARSATAVLSAGAPRVTASGRWSLTGALAEAIAKGGLDLYDDIGGALGSEASAALPGRADESPGPGGSVPSVEARRAIRKALAGVPLSVADPANARCVHLGTTALVADQGHRLAEDIGPGDPGSATWIDTVVEPDAPVHGGPAWLDVCRVRAPLTLGGRNLVMGVDVDRPVRLEQGACLDAWPARDHLGWRQWFCRVYHADDSFKGALGDGGTFGGRPIGHWLARMGATPLDVWDPEDRQAGLVVLARLFPVVDSPSEATRWVWMLDPARGSPEARRLWRVGRRVSLAHIVRHADLDALWRRRLRHRCHNEPPEARLADPARGPAAGELALMLAHADDPRATVRRLLAHADQAGSAHRPAELPPRRLAAAHLRATVAEAVRRRAPKPRAPLADVLPEPAAGPGQTDSARTGSALPDANVPAETWAVALEHRALADVADTMLGSRWPMRSVQVRPWALARDQMVHGSCPLRIDLAGGWTDTPPYCFEHPGRVLNVAVDLSGRPPVQVWVRPLAEPTLRLASIDKGQHVDIRDADALRPARSPAEPFALVRTLLGMVCLVPPDARGPSGLARALRRLGGGIELTTLAAVPCGSGLGTSSILAATVLAVLARAMGQRPTWRDLVADVLALEQCLGTGGGWQDQAGGLLGGAKLLTARPHVPPILRARRVTHALLTRERRAGRLLLYYTGQTRLARGAVRRVVGAYLTRDASALAALAHLRTLAGRAAAALAEGNAAALGRALSADERCHRRLVGVGAPGDGLDGCLRGAKCLGAGGGGFRLLLCRSDDAEAVRRRLAPAEAHTSARWFDFKVNPRGLQVRLC